MVQNPVQDALPASAVQKDHTREWSARNASGEITKLFVNRQLNCSLWESEPNFEWI